MGSNADIELKESAAHVADGYATVFDFQDASTYSRALFQLIVSAVSGTLPTLDVFVQVETPDQGFTDAVAFQRVTGVDQRIAIVVAPTPDAFPNDLAIQDRSLAAGVVRHLPLGPRYRVGWKIGGVSPSFTFKVLGSLHT